MHQGSHHRTRVPIRLSGQGVVRFTARARALLASGLSVRVSAGRGRVQPRSRQVLSGVLAVLLSVAVVACGSASSSSSPSSTNGAPTSKPQPGAGKPAVTLGTKNFTEAFVLGELYTQALRSAGYRVTLTSDIGPSEVVDRALLARRIDGYPEYTGTILSDIAHRHTRPASAAQAYVWAQAFESRRGMEMLRMAPAQDTNVLVAKPVFAAAHHLHSLADLRGLDGGATLGAPPEFARRYEGLLGLRQVYRVTRLRYRALAIGTQYQALERDAVQLANVFTTDGQLSQGGYALLADPRNIFGFQNVTPVIRKDVLEREGPAFTSTINTVSAIISTQALRVMNAAVDLGQQRPADVARQFLKANGLG
jgi:osmoprotectant transport system substrate-binding protein